MRKFALPIIFLSLFLLGTINKAQASTIVKGRVTDLRTGRPVASAQVKLTTLSGSLIASDESNNNGKYKIENPDIPPRPLRYNLEASKEGYQPKTIKVTLKKGQTYTVDFKLKSLPPNKPPVIHSVTPKDNSVFLAGAQITLKVNASDPDRDHLEYQISIGGSIAQPWSSSNAYTWQTQASDTGAVNITCEVRDNKGGQDTKTISSQIINPSAEEVLQKVADNYALVNDKKMDVTMTSKFNNDKFGDTIYTRHYFKKPDKQRTDTFSKENRADSLKTEIQITAGADTYLIDPASHAQSHRNILTELSLTQEQLNQMDEIYHLQDFLSAHTITRLDNPADLTKGLITLEAVPKTTNNIYSKLGIQVDYFKGIKTKSLTYFNEDNQDKLKQAIEIIDTKKMPNAAWVPKAQVKTLYLTEGNLIMTSKFKDIRINTGLDDGLFDAEGQ